MKKLLFMAFALMVSASTWADVVENNETIETEEFASDEAIETGLLNEMISRIATPAEKTEFGAKVTKYASVPKFGGYFIGKYAYSSKEGANSGDGFTQRLIRFYVDGTLLNDFAYRIQLQTNNASFHMKDFFIEWKKYSEFKVKIGQYKRAFGFENPMNPWDVGVGDYSQLTKKLTGHDDYIGAESSSNGGRDQGIQVQGDLFPAKDGHRYIHYQLMLSNGQGINAKDVNSRKDISGTIQVQPIKGLFIGAFGWTGNATYNGITVDKDRYMFSAKYDANGWSARAEYAHSTGHKIADFELIDGVQTLKANASNGRADAWYATVGVPCTPWLKTYVKWDVYRDGASSDKTKSIYSICPNFQLHKNLQFQLQYNYVTDKLSPEKTNKWSEIWVETYVRF